MVIGPSGNMTKHSGNIFYNVILIPTFVSVKVDLYGGVSTRVKDLSGVDLDNGHDVGTRDETEDVTI